MRSRTSHSSRRFRAWLLPSFLLLSSCVEPTPAVGTAPIEVHLSTPVHVVQKGETLFSIARAHGTTWGALQDLNPGVTPEALEVGSTLRLPRKPTVRSVQSGW